MWGWCYYIMEWFGTQWGPLVRAEWGPSGVQEEGRVDAEWMLSGCKVEADWEPSGYRVGTEWVPSGCQVGAEWVLSGRRRVWLH